MSVPFTSPCLLAPMEGVTDPAFRDVVLRLHDPASLGGAFTEFLRVVSRVPPRRTFKKHLGERQHSRPVGLQLMGSEAGLLAACAARAVEVGAVLVDLNFGCPARGALRGCAGSALLETPEVIEEIVGACVRAVPGVPVSAKIRAGVEDDSRLEELARAVEAGGAALLTVHCRTRREGFQEEADWSRLRRAVEVTSIPVCGNGGVRVHADIRRLRAETGCSFTMVGRAALADPWIFSGYHATRSEAAAFLRGYWDAMCGPGSAGQRRAAARTKQLLNHWTAGGLVDGDRLDWLREKEPARILARLAAVQP